MKKSRVIKILVSVLIVLTAGNIMAGQVREGGPGIIREGEYLTFGDAKVPVRLNRSNIPSLKIVEDALMRMPISNVMRGELLQAVLPSIGRTYYDIDALKDHERKELIEIYRKAMGLGDDENVTIYAVTNPLTKETFILPDFYKIRSDFGRAANIFHESSWIIGRQKSNLSYREYMELEMSFQKYIEQNITEPDYDVADLCRDLGTSRMQLYRKLKAIVGYSANELIRKIRLHKAAELLLRGDLNIAQVTYEVGFTDLQYFRMCFKDEFELTPSQYIRANTKDDGQTSQKLDPFDQE